MKIALIKIQNYYDLGFRDALTNFDKNKSIKIDYSDKKALKNIKKNEAHYKIIFPEVVKLLNKKHNVQLSDQFWQILIGPWLYKVLEFFYDKYLIVKEIPSNLKIEFQENYFTRHYFNSIYDLYINEKFIKYSIYSINNSLEINKKQISLKDKQYLEDKLSEKNNLKTDRKVFKSILKEKIRSIIYFIILQKKYKDKILNINLSLNSVELKTISDRYNNLSKQFINLVKTNKNPSKNKLIEIKIQKDFKDEFLNSLKEIIHKWIPIEYDMEFSSNFNYYKKYVNKINPSIILLRGPHETSIKIRFLIALLKEYKNSNILSFQEGGIGKYQYQKHYENYSLNGTDYFAQWSKFSSRKNIISFYLTKTYWITEYKLPKNNDILIILGSFRKFFFSYYEGHLPDYSFIQLKIIEKLLMEGNIFERSTIRFHNDYQFNEKKYLYKKFKKLKISTRENTNTFFHLFTKFSLKIFLSDYTANMQSMIINHPTILILDKKELTNNEIYSDVYIKLFENNMLFYSPIKLIDFINKNLSTYDKIINWWYSKNVQYTKNLYISFLCRKNLKIDEKFIKLVNQIQ